MRSPLVFAVLLAVAVLAISGRSRASDYPRLGVDWASLRRALEGLRSGIPGSADSSSAVSLRATTKAPEAIAAAVVTAEVTPWLSSPTAVLSVVARDWEGAKGLAGPTSSSDAIRVSRSSRMLVGRVAMAVGRLAPFLHIGVGQWRDPDPHLVSPSTQNAALTGAGIEVSLFAGCGVTIEYDWTTMVLESRRAEAVASRYLGWGEAFAVARWNFETTASGPRAR
jgi:hypothetical protein